MWNIRLSREDSPAKQPRRARGSHLCLHLIHHKFTIHPWATYVTIFHILFCVIKKQCNHNKHLCHKITHCMTLSIMNITSCLAETTRGQCHLRDRPASHSSPPGRCAGTHSWLWVSIFPEDASRSFWTLCRSSASHRAREPRRRGHLSHITNPTQRSLERGAGKERTGARETEREPHSDTAAVHTHARSGRHHGHTSTDGSAASPPPPSARTNLALGQPAPPPLLPPSQSSISPPYPSPCRGLSSQPFFFSLD